MDFQSFPKFKLLKFDKRSQRPNVCFRLCFRYCFSKDQRAAISIMSTFPFFPNFGRGGPQIFSQKVKTILIP